MALSSFDEFNILYVSKMTLSEKEKYLRLKIATEFELRIKKLLEKQQEVVNSNLTTSEILFALSLFNVPLVNQYRIISEKYYSMYVSLISSSNGVGYTKADSWIKQRSVDFANQIQETTAANYEKDDIFSDRRIREISWTETNGLCELATLDGFYKEGYRRKKWISFLDGKTRDSHVSANGQVQLLDAPFSVGNSLLMFPQDSSMGASAKEIVNCRCVMVPVK